MRGGESGRFYVLFSLIEPDGLNSVLYISKLMRPTRPWLEKYPSKITLNQWGNVNLGLESVLFKMYIYCGVLFPLLILSILVSASHS